MNKEPGEYRFLARAFRGRLVPTEAELAWREGRPHEPASALLERSRADHERSAREADGMRVQRRRTIRKG
jgi:type I restriction enzyme, S subunit